MAVLKAARQSGAREVIAVMQPHRYSRLQSLFPEFCTCMNDASTVIVADVYAAGEPPIPGVTRDALVDGLRANGHRSVVPLPGPGTFGRNDPRHRPLRRHGGVPGGREHHRLGARAAGPVDRVASQAPGGVRHDDPDAAMGPGRRLPSAPAGCRRTRRSGPNTWFRVGGAAEVLVRPSDQADLATLLAGLPHEVPVTVIGAASNLIIRDGGVHGVVVRLARGFTTITADGGRASSPAPPHWTRRSPNTPPPPG